MKIRNLFKKVGSGLVLAAAAGASQAAIDVTAVTTAVGEAATAAGLIGAGVLVMIVGIKVYKWVRGAM